MFEFGVRNTVSKSSPLLISSFMRERDLNTENVPSRVNGILALSPRQTESDLQHWESYNVSLVYHSVPIPPAIPKG